MKRRAFLGTIAGAALARPLAVRAQEAGRVYRLAMLGGGKSSATEALLETLRRSGFVEGENLRVEHRGFAQHADLIPQYAAELVKADPDVLFATGDAAIRAMQKLSPTIPLLGVTEDMVGSSFVKSLAHPEGNTTGVSLLSAELDIKRQQILIDAVPAMRRMAALVDGSAVEPARLQEMQAEARAHNVELSLFPITKPAVIAPAIAEARSSGAAALSVLASPMLFGNRIEIMQRAASASLPSIYQFADMAVEGGFAAYGPTIKAVFGDTLARQMVKHLRGAKPSDLPVEQPARFDLVINLRVAKTIGLEVPPTLLARADDVIE
jgi:putative tryptophan/tyrosine transport system substrate-binding protein